MPNLKKLQIAADLIADECISVRVRMLSRVITAIYDDAFRSTGLTANQFNMLVVMIKMKKPTAKSVARMLKMETSTVSRNLERMMKRGWLTIQAQDGRRQELGVTKKGIQLVEKALPAWRKAQARAQAVLGKKEFSTLTQITEVLWNVNRKGS
jgi:DNA-binding MarR family transcriptional regulator